MTRLGRAILSIAFVFAFPAWAQSPSAPVEQQRARPDENDIVVTAQQNWKWSKWVRAESPNLTVYGSNEAEVRQMTVKLERFDQLLRLLTRSQATEPTNPLSIYLVLGTNEIERLRRQPAGTGTLFTGYYSASPTGMLAAADMRLDRRSNQIPRYQDVWLFTEYCRHFLRQSGRSGYLPTWYVDGLSLNLSTTILGENSVEYGRAHPSLANKLELQRWEPIERIIDGRLDAGQLYSAESSLLVHFILAEPARRKAFDRFLASVRGGVEPVAAFEGAFGISMKKLQSQLWRYRETATYVRASTSGFIVPEITVSRLPRSADALLLDQAAMRIGIPETDRQHAVLRRAEKAAADRGDPFAQRVLVQAQILYGAPEQADAALDTLLQSAPADAELLYFKGLRHLMIARGDDAQASVELREARKWFARAFRSNPDYYPALYAWAESLWNEPRFVSDNTRDVLLKAAFLAPQATQIQVSAAILLMIEGRYEAGEALLQAITVTPRDQASEQVPTLLKRARARDRIDRSELLASFRYVTTWKDLNCC